MATYNRDWKDLVLSNSKETIQVIKTVGVISKTRICILVRLEKEIKERENLYKISNTPIVLGKLYISLEGNEKVDKIVRVRSIKNRGREIIKGDLGQRLKEMRKIKRSIAKLLRIVRLYRIHNRKHTRQNRLHVISQ